jgi:hypothetical protein
VTVPQPERRTRLTIKDLHAIQKARKDGDFSTFPLELRQKAIDCSIALQEAEDLAATIHWDEEDEQRQAETLQNFAERPPEQPFQRAASSDTLARLRWRERLGKLFGSLIFGVVASLSLYLWLGVLGGGSFKKGLEVTAAIFAFVVVAALPKDIGWAKVTKGIVLTAGTLWTLHPFLPIRDEVGLVLALLVAGIVGLLGYLMLFEHFFG